MTESINRLRVCSRQDSVNFHFKLTESSGGDDAIRVLNKRYKVDCFKVDLVFFIIESKIGMGL